MREGVVRGTSIVFTRKAVVDETFIRKSASIFKSTVGIGSSQLYPCSICQPMPTGHYTHWEFDSETSRFTPRQNKTCSFENLVMSLFQRTRPKCEIESFFTKDRQKKIDCFSVDEFCSPCNTVFEAMGCFYHFCPCQELRPSITEEDIQRGCNKREIDALRQHFIQEKGSRVIDMWECEWWRLYKSTKNFHNISKKTFLTGVHLQLSNFQKKLKKESFVIWVRTVRFWSTSKFGMRI